MKMADSASSFDPMIVWLDDSSIDLSWLRHHTRIRYQACSVEDISNETRRFDKVCDGSTLRLTIGLERDGAAHNNVDDSSTTKSIVVKQVPPAGRPLSKQLGLAREALFYDQLAPDLNTSEEIIPHIFYSWGDIESGSKVVLMEDLSQKSLDSGVFFGPGNPNNWNRNLDEQVKRAGANPPSAAEVAQVTFKAMAKVHATFWEREDLLDPKYDWLRGHQWLLGKGKDSWEASQQLVQNFWQACLKREADGHSTIRWDPPTVREAVEAAVKGISWDAQTKRLHRHGHWTLVHGDFWPGNCMWMIESEQNSIRLLDWEMVGLGSGPQDLGQYILSNMDPAERRKHERSLVEAYFEELKRCGVQNIDWEYCWSEYKIGGLERWLWFLIYFVGQDGMLDWAQFFHNQIASFMTDHNLTAKDVVQPRP